MTTDEFFGDVDRTIFQIPRQIGCRLGALICDLFGGNVHVGRNRPSKNFTNGASKLVVSDLGLDAALKPAGKLPRRRLLVEGRPVGKVCDRGGAHGPEQVGEGITS